MRYIDYFKNKINSIPVSVTSKTVESILVRLFSAFTELVENQIQFLHQSNKLHLINNAIPLLQYVRGSNIPVDFYQPSKYKCLVKFTSTDQNAQWQGTTLDNITYVYRGGQSNLAVLNTVLIPASNTNVSEEVEVTLYGVNDKSVEAIVFTGADFVRLNADIVWSDSIMVYVGTIKWRRIKHLREATDNCYLVTLNEYRRPIIVFPKNTPVGSGRIEYRYIETVLDTNVAITGGTQPEFTASVRVVEATKYTTLPNINNLKNIVREYYSKTEWTPEEVEQVVVSIVGVQKAKVTRLETNLILIEVSTIDNTLIGYLGLIEEAIQGYKDYTQDEVIVRLSAICRFNMSLTIYGVENYDVRAALNSYLNSNTVLKLGDIYELIENNITGNSQINEAYFAPILHVEELSTLTMQVSNFNTILNKVYLQVIAVTDNNIYIYQIVDGEAKFITSTSINMPPKYITLLDDSLLKVSFIGSVEVGKHNLYELLPSLTAVGELEPEYNFAIGDIFISYK